MSRTVNFDEDPRRMERKLEEMTTIDEVYVDMEPYPSRNSGGWGGVAVQDGEAGGYVWKVTTSNACLQWDYASTWHSSVAQVTPRELDVTPLFPLDWYHTKNQ